MHYRDRLQRPRAYNDPGHAHELTFSCYHRFPFLAKERCCQWLAEELKNACREFGYSLWAYVFMPDHVHLIVHPTNRVYDDSEFLKKVKEPVSRKAVQFLKRQAPEFLPRIRVQQGEKIEHHFWQPGRGYDRNISSPRVLQAMIDYIHLNPVRKGLVEHARDWKWSSAGWFEGESPNALMPDPIPWDWLEEVW